MVRKGYLLPQERFLCFAFEITTRRKCNTIFMKIHFHKLSGVRTLKKEEPENTKTRINRIKYKTLKLTMRFVFDIIRVLVCTVAVEMTVVFDIIYLFSLSVTQDTVRNPSEFPHSFLEGSWEGFWWAFITMTTVG